MSRLLWPRRLAHGLLAGLLLSCLRAPLGLDWTQLAAVQGTTAAVFRAGALLALALALHPARPALRAGLGAGWLAALAAGFGLHGLVLDATPTSRAGYALLLVAGTLGLRALAGRRARGADGEPEPLGRGERLGLVLVGIGSALALESLAHETRLFGMATSADDTLMATVFLTLLALAAAAFGPLVLRLGQERVRFAVGVALAGASALAGLVFLAQLTPDGLHSYLRRLDHSLGWLRALDEGLGGRLALARMPTLDGASIGTLWATLLLSAAALVVPGFVLGATLGATRHAGRVAHALTGAALGLVLLPSLIRAHGEPLDLERVRTAAFAWELVVAGATIAATGVALVGLAAPRARLVALALAACVAFLPWIRARLVVWSFSPWAPSPVQPELVWPTAEGLLTVERARDGTRILTLDRRRLTPIADEEVAEERRLRHSFDLLSDEQRGRPVRALFLGQLTPVRLRVLRSLGTLELERSAPWHAAMPAVDELLFLGQPAPAVPIVTPSAARERLAEGAYDWVVAPATSGPIVTWKSEAREVWGSAEAPRLSALDLGGGVGVAWIESDSLFRRGTELGPLMLELDRLEGFQLGLVRGTARLAPLESGPRFECALRAGPRPLEFLTSMPQQRRFELQRAWAASVVPDPAPELVRGLALHFGAQKLSNPYESRAAQVELDEDALRAFLKAVPAPGALDELSHELWSSLARLLTEKREPELVVVYVEPVAERFAPWPELDLAVAHAHRELLEPEEAVRFLQRARTARPLDLAILLESALCFEDLDDPRSAVELLEEARARGAGQPELERALGLALMRADDERGRAIVERFLKVYPEDEELLRALGRDVPESDDH